MASALRLAAVIVLAAALVGTQVAAAVETVDRLPHVKPGRLLPSAGGLVLGKTTRPQLLARWGPASECPQGASSCSWIVGIARNGSIRRGETADYITVVFDQRTRWAYNLTMRTNSAQKSRLRGWRMPEGIGIGSPFTAVKRAYPKVRYLRSGAANMSTWGVLSYEHAAGHYILNFTFDRATRAVSSGRVVSFDLIWQLPRFTCSLAAASVPPPDGAAAGTRVRGSCAGAATYFELQGRRFPLELEFLATRGGEITSATSPFDPDCSPERCKTRVADWEVDVTLGISAPGTRLEARIQIPPGAPYTGSASLKIPLG